MKTITITLPPNAPPGLRRALEQLPAATIEHGEGMLMIISLPGRAPLRFNIIDHQVDRAKGTRSKGAEPLVYRSRMSARARDDLRGAGINFVDGAGNAMIIADGLYVALGIPAKPATTMTSRKELGHVGIRAAQILVDHTRDTWSTTALAEAAGVSIGQAHNVLHILEQEGLVRATGARNKRDRTVIDPGALLDHLATHRLTMQAPTPSALGYLPARDPDGIARQLDAAASDVPWAISGIAAASLYGHPVASSVPITAVRIDIPSGEDLIAAMTSLGFEPSDRGANVRVIRDTGRVGTHDRRAKPTGALAPPSRVYLDMFSEGRGEDAAELFRPAVLELAR